jgi:hypothetical protein|tara:strand:- start:227 stop:538 length:312 start_codon:yes stop_codon:yes gene_type:complete
VSFPNSFDRRALSARIFAFASRSADFRNRRPSEALSFFISLNRVTVWFTTPKASCIKSLEKTQLPSTPRSISTIDEITSSLVTTSSAASQAFFTNRKASLAIA